MSDRTEWAVPDAGLVALLVEAAPVGIVQFDVAARVVQANAAAAGLLDRSLQELPGVDAAAALGAHAQALVPLLHAVLDAGACGARNGATSAVLDVELRDGERVLAASCFALRRSGDAAAPIVGAGLLLRDATAQARDGEAVHDAQLALARVRTRLDHVLSMTEVGLSHLSLDEVLQNLLVRVRELLGAERAAVLLLEEQGRRLSVRATIGADEDAALTLQFPSADEFLELVGGGRALGGSAGLREEALAATPAGAYMPEGEGYLVGIPLYAGDRLTGILQVSSSREPALGEEQLALLGLIARRGALAIEQASLYERDHRTAETLQRSLLPERFPVTPGLAAAARYLPGTEEAEVGGDWYDVLPVAYDRVCVAIGDVVGKGLRAASEMGQLRNGFRAFALEGFGPAAILERLSRLARITEVGEYSTAAVLVLDPQTGALTMASAGHLPPLVVHADGRTEYLEGGRSLPLGVPSARGFRRASYVLEPGARLILYTDGLVERRGRGIDVGLAALAEAAASGPVESEPLIDRLLERLVDMGNRDDDVGVVVLRLLPASLEPLRLRLPAEPVSLAPLRAELRRWLEAAGLEAAAAYDVVVAVNEAAANAIEHPDRPRAREIEVVAVRDDGTVDVVVHDTGRWRTPRPRAGRGLGLSIARRIMQSVEIEAGDGGTVVRLRHRVSGPEDAAPGDQAHGVV